MLSVCFHLKKDIAFAVPAVLDKSKIQYDLERNSRVLLDVI